MSALQDAIWPAARRGEALYALCRRTQLSAAEAAPPPALAHEPPELERYAEQLGLELEPLVLTRAEAATRLSALAPVLLSLKREHAPGWFAVLGGRAGQVRVLAPDGGERTLPTAALCATIWGEVEAELGQTFEPLLAAALPSPRRRARARALLVADAMHRDFGCRALLLKAAPGAELGTWSRQFGVWRKALGLLGLHAAQYLLGLGAFWIIGRAVLRDRIDAGTFAAFALLSLSAVPLHLLETAQLSELALRLSALFKQRAFADALASDQDALRRRGVGEHFGHVLDCDAFESLAVTGGLAGGLALIELGAAAVILVSAAGPVPGLALALWIALLGLLGARYLAHARRFASARLELTHALVERMLGHRTRLVQEPRARWHAGEDEQLERYLHAGRGQDQAAARLVAWSGRGFFALSIPLLAPLWLRGPGASSGLLASSLAGALLATRALSRLASSLTALCEAKLAYERLQSLHARPGLRARPVPAVFEPAQPSAAGELVLRVDDLSYRAGQRPEPVLRGCSLQLSQGERWLLTGSSGSGKSTLVSLLAGLRVPASGSVLWRGLDLTSLGLAGWRKHVALAPQFHDNHVLSGTLAFNLLLGRSWPPSAAELAEAEALCHELGLGELLERMPGRLQQQLGETGWQLSHGERSRLFLARALLSRAQLVLLDETFAALDPVTLETCMKSALRHAPTLVVVAHP
jgi:ATP-binding cassette subfamily B protein